MKNIKPYYFRSKIAHLSYWFSVLGFIIIFRNTYSTLPYMHTHVCMYTHTHTHTLSLSLLIFFYSYFFAMPPTIRPSFQESTFRTGPLTCSLMLGFSLYVLGSGQETGFEIFSQNHGAVLIMCIILSLEDWPFHKVRELLTPILPFFIFPHPQPITEV